MKLNTKVKKTLEITKEEFLEMVRNNIKISISRDASVGITECSNLILAWDEDNESIKPNSDPS